MSVYIERYRPELLPLWNAFLAASRNGTFLLDRGYMDYHADRFVDHSLVLRNESGNITALLPANEHDGSLHSHAGLTYGGLILGARAGAAAVLAMIEAVRTYLRDYRVSALHYKTIPWIYHRQPAEDDRYALFRAGARLARRDVLSVAPREHRLGYQERRVRGIKSARKAGVQVAECTDYAAFWDLLTDNLVARHGVQPVHTLAEIEYLQARFPDAIRLFTAYCSGDLVAGAVIYESAMVAHVQYISASDAGRRTHALDALFAHLLNDIYAAKPYFDFGISNEAAGEVLNVGLVEHKEGFGARSVVHDYYELIP